jgi:ribosomal protein L17
MARSHMFKKRLGMYSKQRVSMLRNMTAALVMHEKVTTTSARAKVLIPFFNNFYMKAIKADNKAWVYAHSVLKRPDASHKFFNNLLNRYK